MARRAGLVAADVEAAAVELADQHGLDAVTLTAVAQRLGVRSPSLYTYVDGMAGLRRMVALHAAELLRTALAEGQDSRPGSAVRSAAHAFRRFVVAHPGLYAATFPAPRPGEDDELYDALAAAAAPVSDAIVATGLTGPAAVHATRALRSAVHGFVTLEQAGGFGQPVDIDASFDAMVDLLIAGLVPAEPGADPAPLSRARGSRRGRT